MNERLNAHEYWLNSLQSLPPVRQPLWPISPGRSRNAVDICLPAIAARKLQELTNGAPLLRHAAIVAAVQVALARHTGLGKVVVGSPPRRSEGEVPAANTLPIIQSVSADLTFRALLGDVRRSLLDAFALQAFPSRQVFQELQFDSAPVKVAVALEDFTGPLDIVPELLVDARVDAHRVNLRLQAREHVGPDPLRVFGEHVARILAAGVEEHEIALGSIELVTAEERQCLLYEWNQTDGPRPFGSVVALFEAQAALRPTAPALVGQYPSSYGQLNASANRLVYRLRELGVGRETRVAVFLRSPEEMISSILAVLKAGAAYVPLDPDYPRARIRHMLADAEPSVIVADAATADELPATSVPLISPEKDPVGPDPGNPAIPIDAAQLAYVIYTSGSTGEPRGVMITHESLANAIGYFVRRSGIDHHARVSQLSSFSFDASALECYLALTSGAALCIAPRDARASGPRLSAFLQEEAVTVIGAITPSVLSLIDSEDVTSVRVIHIGAEKCPGDLANMWSRGRLLLNCYGPTEATIDCVCGPCLPGEGDPPLGSPITNARAYVLDSEFRPVPVGVVGELYLGGIPVARGYIGRPAATAAAFVPDPFGRQPGGRLYRTGDLGRFRSDGRLDFCGRADRQVKIDGVRIELGEIEAALRTHPDVAQAVADVDDTTDQRKLVAYVVSAAGRLPARTLREHLAAALPASMLPSAFVEVKELPITPNGKLDRARLPKPDPDVPDPAESSAGPLTDIELALAGIWGEVLQIDGVGRDSDFFELGGRSLQVTRVMSKVAKVFSVRLPMEAMFSAPTPAGLAVAVAAARGNGDGVSEPLPLLPLAERPAVLPLSFAQQRLWFLHQVLPPETAGLYNGPLPARLQGPLDRDALQRSFDEIVRRHEVLRTAFRMVDGQPTQVILPELRVIIEPLTARGSSAAARVAEVDALAEADAMRPFDLEQPPLLRARLVTLGPDDHVLLLNIHHIIFDGWSVGVLLTELTHLYNAFVRGEPSPLPPLPLQYADFTLWQRRWLSGSLLDEQILYWRKQLANAPDLELPTDADRPPVPTYRGKIKSFRLSRDLREALNALGLENNVTLFMVLFAGFTTVLHRYTAQDDIIISTPVAGRTRSELEQLLGFFVNSLVLRVDLSGNPTFRELLQRVRLVTLGAYDHQDVPFERLVKELRPDRAATHNPLFRAAFSLQNTPQPQIDLSGLNITPWETHNETTKFDLVVAIIDTEEGLAVDVEYSDELFEEQTIAGMIEFYLQLLEYIADDPDCPLLEIPLQATQGPVVPLMMRETFTFE